MKLVMDTRPFPFRTTGARIAVLGYGPSAAQQALGLRDAGNEVSVGTRLGGMSWVRARKDGFPVGSACAVVEGASVVVVLVPDDEQAPVYWHAIEPGIEPRALLVTGRALALATRALDPRTLDVVFVAAQDRTCRVAVHNDATGRALERAISYARAAFGLDVTIATTTIAAEVDAEIAELETRAGGAAAFRSYVENASARVRFSHAPEEARLAYYEGLNELVEDRARRNGDSGEDGEGDRESGLPQIAYGPTRGMS
jgi:ketol-acid reductoisomerase